MHDDCDEPRTFIRWIGSGLFESKGYPTGGGDCEGPASAHVSMDIHAPWTHPGVLHRNNDGKDSGGPWEFLPDLYGYWGEEYDFAPWCIHGEIGRAHV